MENLTISDPKKGGVLQLVSPSGARAHVSYIIRSNAFNIYRFLSCTTVLDGYIFKSGRFDINGLKGSILINQTDILISYES